LDLLLSQAGFTTAPLDYGNFLALQLLVRWSRQKKVQWLRDECERVYRTTGDDRPSIIAHSFGTYLVAQAINLYQLAFDRLVFCGAIVRQDYPWTRVFSQGLVRSVLNDYGHRDFWAWIVEYVVKNAGRSGVKGFQDLAEGRVLQREHSEFRHSDYFYDRNYRKNWIPFLQGETPPPLLPTDRRPPNWRFRIPALLVSLVVMIGLGYLGYQLYLRWIGGTHNRSATSISFKAIEARNLLDLAPLSALATKDIIEAATRSRARTKLPEPQEAYLGFISNPLRGAAVPMTLVVSSGFRGMLAARLLTQDQPGFGQAPTEDWYGERVQIQEAPEDRWFQLVVRVFPYDEEAYQTLLQKPIGEIIKVVPR
jgi:hypothetical protein